jgi:hypothetical protein
MPINFDEISSIEVLDSSRHTLTFPKLPNQTDGKILTLHHGAITLPTFSVGHIQEKVLGWPVAFSGRRSFDNILSVDFVESVGGPITKSFVSWNDLCTGHKSSYGELKAKYSVRAKLELFDTTGKSSLTFNLINLWPKTINVPELAEESAPAHVRVEFSIDDLELTGLSYNKTVYNSSSPISVSSSKPDDYSNFSKKLPVQFRQSLNILSMLSRFN